VFGLLALCAVLIAIIIYLVGFHHFDVPLGVYTPTVQKLGLSFLQMLGMLGVFKARGTQVFNDVMSRPSHIVGGSITSLLPVKCLMGSQSYGPFFLNMALPFVVIALASVVMIPKRIAERYLRNHRSDEYVKAPTFKGMFNLPRKLAPCRVLRQPMTDSDIAAWRAPFRAMNRMAGVTVFTFFSLYPTLVASIVSIFNCTEPVDGTRYLFADLTVKCFDGGHIAMLCFACIGAAVYAVGIPVAVAMVTALKTPIVCRGAYDAEARHKPWTAPRGVCARRDPAKSILRRMCAHVSAFCSPATRQIAQVSWLRGRRS
jgi:hypothetical protein